MKFCKKTISLLSILVILLTSVPVSASSMNIPYYTTKSYTVQSVKLQKDVYSNCSISYMYYSETMGLFKAINPWNKSNKVF